MPKKEPAPIPNSLKDQREKVLGLSKKDLSRLCDVSEKTIQRVERHKRGFRRVTYTKILKGVNKARKKDDLAPIPIEELFPSLSVEDERPKPKPKKSTARQPKTEPKVSKQE